MGSDRARYLDSLRGIAAMLVVTAHFLGAFYPFAVFAGGTSSNGPFAAHVAWESWLHWPPMSLLTSGHFAVCLFFVLSGYVLSYRFIGEPAQRQRICGAIIKRPFRLAGLTFASVLAGALLWSVGWLFHLDAAVLSGSAPWLSKFWVGDFSWAAFWHDLIRAKAGFEYNPPLWTIKIEVIGSFLVFFVLLAINGLSWAMRTLVLLVLLIIIYGTYYDGFLIGMLLADATRQSRARESRARHVKLPGLAFWILTAAVFALAGYPYYAAPALLPDWQALTPHLSMLAAVIVFGLIHGTAQWRHWLVQPWLVRLGDISFAVYVLHFLLMGSLTAWLVVTISPKLGYGLATILAAAVSLPILLALSSLATRWIDEPSIGLGRHIEQWVDRKLLSRIQLFSEPSR